jgi:hypothetical protein
MLKKIGMRRLLLVIMILFLNGLEIPIAIEAQDGQPASCPQVVNKKLYVVDQNCGALGRNELCYGNQRVEVTLRDPESDWEFARPSDLLPIAEVSTLQTSAFDQTADEWGIAVLNLQIESQDIVALPGQVVSFLLMGDSQIDMIDETRPLEAGKNRLSKAFYFSTGIGIPTCQEAPDALLVQSPDNMKVSFNLNGMEVSIGSTVSFTMKDVPGKGRTLISTLVEGQMQAMVGQETFTLSQPGESAGVTVNEEGLIGEESEVIRESALGENTAPDSVVTLISTVHQRAENSDENSVEESSSGCEAVPVGYNVNLRTGPGVGYEVGGYLMDGEKANVVTQARDEAGAIWWKLENGLWVSSEVVNNTGACEIIPTEVVEPPSISNINDPSTDNPPDQEKDRALEDPSDQDEPTEEDHTSEDPSGQDEPDDDDKKEHPLGGPPGQEGKDHPLGGPPGQNK